jgi:hypothetical protein
MDLLVDNLGVEDPVLKFNIVKALNRLRDTRPDLPVPHAPIEERIKLESRSYYKALSIFRAIEPNTDGRKAGLLAGALQARLDQKLEVIFRLLGLKYPQKDIYFAFSALKGTRGDNRTAAIEFLDNVLEAHLKPVILPLLEESSPAALLERAKVLFGMETVSRNDGLRGLLEEPDSWLKACALHEVGEKRIRELLDQCRALVADGDPLIRETAAWAVSKCA